MDTNQQNKSNKISPHRKPGFAKKRKNRNCILLGSHKSNFKLVENPPEHEVKPHVHEERYIHCKFINSVQNTSFNLYYILSKINIRIGQIHINNLNKKYI